MLRVMRSNSIGSFAENHAASSYDVDLLRVSRLTKVIADLYQRHMTLCFADLRDVASLHVLLKRPAGLNAKHLWMIALGRCSGGGEDGLIV